MKKFFMKKFSFCFVIGFAITFIITFVITNYYAVCGDIYSIRPRPKTAYNIANNSFTITKNTFIVVPESATWQDWRAIAFLQKNVREQINDTLQISSVPVKNGIIIGVKNSSSLIKDVLDSVCYNSEKPSTPQGYVIHVSNDFALLCGFDSDGLFYSATTFIQLFNKSQNSVTVQGSHVWDFPDYPVRWVFSQHNMLTQVSKNMKQIIDTMTLRKLNGLQQSDFKLGLLSIMQKNYFDSVEKVKQWANAGNIEIIPTTCGIGWSSQLLYQTPNLATGFPAKSVYTVEADTGKIIPDNRVALPNGNFENLSSNGQFSGWSFYDGANQSTFVDENIFHSGKRSARCENFKAGNSAGNCRFSRNVQCDSFKYYTMSAWIKTENFKTDLFQLLALSNTGRGLTYTALNIPQTTNGWIKIEARFNTLNFTNINLYVGAWGGQSGTFWVDDFQVQEAGMCNVLRRAGTPLWVRNKNTGAIYTEGKDYEPILDSVIFTRRGDFGPYHTPPTVRKISSGKIKNGDTLLVTYFHPLTCVADNDVNGSVMVSMSEDTLYKLIQDEVTRINTLFQPNKFFMAHDEIRAFGWDSADLKRNISAADMLADNIKKCDSIIKKTAKVQNFIWSDMLDSLHNAVNNYYLVNGDLRGVWDKVPKDLVIVNWNLGRLDESLSFFEKKNFSQITSPYYDAGNSNGIKSVRLSMQNHKNILGSMYTTWSSDYRFLTAFADYMWNAGAYIVHTPIDSNLLQFDRENKNPLQIDTEIFSDINSSTDTVDSVWVEGTYALGSDTFSTFKTLLKKISATKYQAFIPNSGYYVRYKIVAVSKQLY